MKSKPTKQSKKTYRRKSTKRKKRLPLWIRRRLMPIVLLLCLLNFLFPTQSHLIRQKLSDWIGAPAYAQLTASLSEQFPFLDDLADFSIPDLLPASLKLPGRSSSGSDEFEVHFLDVGQGLSILVQSDGHALLYDGGDRSASSFVVSYLQEQGIDHLDYLIASHYDSDHLSGLIGVLRTTSVDTVMGPDYVHDSQTYTAFQNAVRATNHSVAHPSVGSEYQLGSAVFTVLSPDRISKDSNNNSLAILVTNGSNRFLFTGDAETPEEEAICQSGLSLKCDVICPGHHGSSTATSNLFLSYTKPEWAVISVGAGNDYGHPHYETLQRLSDAGVKVLRTDEQGTIIASSDGTNITWK